MHIQKLNKEHIPELLEIQENVDIKFFNKRNLDNFKNLFDNGFCVGVFKNKELVGYSRVLFDLPDKNKKITDYYCRFKTATFNGSVIKPEYRGLNLQYEMHQYSLKNIQDKKIILSLVHPDNINSKRNLDKSGFKEIDKIFVYGEKDRLLMEKKL